MEKIIWKKRQMSMTPEGLTKLANGISHFKSLKRFYFTQIRFDY